MPVAAYAAMNGCVTPPGAAAGAVPLMPSTTAGLAASTPL